MSQLPNQPEHSTPKNGTVLSFGGLELRLTHSLLTPNTEFLLEGQLAGGEAERHCTGGSLQIRNAVTGLVEEAFFAADGCFTQPLTIAANSDTPFVVALCDGLGEVVATRPITIRHRAAGSAAEADPKSSVLTKPLALEVRGRNGQCELQIIARAGASLPGKFICLCRTIDQCGRVVVPLWEASRLVHQLVVGELDPQLPIGVPVDIELNVEADSSMTLRVLVRQAGRGEMVQIPSPAKPGRPTPEEVNAAAKRISELLPDFKGQYGESLRESFHQHNHSVQDALAANEGEKAGGIMTLLREQLEQMALAKLQVGYPPPQRLRRLVKRCLFEAGNLASRTGRDRDQLFSIIYAHEQAAEEAHAEKNATRYRETFGQLSTLASDLERGQQEALPYSLREQPRMPSVHDVADELNDLQAYTAIVLQAAELLGKEEMAKRLRAVDQQRTELADRAKRDAAGAWRDARRALAEVAGLEQTLTGGRTRASTPRDGMLEASS